MPPGDGTTEDTEDTEDTEEDQDSTADEPRRTQMR
jgi:hypothetical protein